MKLVHNDVVICEGLVASQKVQRNAWRHKVNVRLWAFAVVKAYGVPNGFAHRLAALLRQKGCERPARNAPRFDDKNVRATLTKPDGKSRRFTRTRWCCDNHWLWRAYRLADLFFDLVDG